MRGRGWLGIGGAMVAAVLIAGCATAVNGVAGVDTAQLAVLTARTSPTETGPTETSTSETSTTDTSSTQTTPTDTSPTDTSPSESEGPGDGPYPTTPRDLPATPSTDQQAALLEGRRIAGYLPVPTQIDASYKKNASLSTLPLKSASALSLLLTDPAPEVAERNGMLAGFSSARSTSDSKSMVVAALEFPDAAAATKAATALAEASHDKDSDSGKVTVPGYPKAAGWVGGRDPGSYAHAFLAQGAMVLYAWVDDDDGATAKTQPELLGKIFKAETAAMASFKPAGKDGMAKLPTDVDGILAHTVPQSADNATVVDGLYTAAAELHFDTDPVETGRLFQAAGVDEVAQGRLTLYRAKDSTGAAKIRAQFIEMMQASDSSWKPYQFTGDVPEISCIQQALNSAYYCVAVNGRFAIEGYATSEPDLVQAFTAQTRLLAG